jgi:hypothetical protein
LSFFNGQPSSVFFLYGVRCTRVISLSVDLLKVVSFGFTSFGRIVGSANFIAGCVGLLQFGVSYVTFEVFGGDFLFYNIFNLAICFPTFFVAWSFGNAQTKVVPLTISVQSQK